MLAGIDVASQRHVLARLDGAGTPIGPPTPITEDQAGYAKLLELLAPPPALVVMEATGHYWKNLFAVLTAAGHEVALVNPLQARRFQEAGLERTKTDAIDASGLARLAFDKRPSPTRLHDAVAEALRELVRHRDRLRQDFDDRVRQLHRLVDLGFPEFTRYVRTLDSMLATCLLAEHPTARAFARANPRRLPRLRYGGRHLVGAELAEQLVEAAKRSIGQHHGAVYDVQARHLCQDLVLWRRRLAEIERDIAGLLDRHEVGKLLTTIDGIGPQSAAYVGVVPGLRQSGQQTRTRAAIAPIGNARLRRALWMPVLGAVRRNPWLRACHDRLRANGKPPKLALIAAMRKLLHAVHSVARNKTPFASAMPEQRRAA